MRFCRNQNLIFLPNYIVNKSLYIRNCGTEKLDSLKIVLFKVEWFLRLLSLSWEVWARLGVSGFTLLNTAALHDSQVTLLQGRDQNSVAALCLRVLSSLHGRKMLKSQILGGGVITEI